MLKLPYIYSLLFLIGALKENPKSAVIGAYKKLGSGCAGA